MKEETETALEQWGAWSKDGGPLLSYKHKTTFAIVKTKFGYCISDDDAMRVDEIVSGLESPVKEFVKDYYLNGSSIYKISIKYKMRREKVQLLKSTALHDVEKELFKK